MKKHVVVQREYEKGWGSKDFIATEYESEELAKAKVIELNAENNLPKLKKLGPKWFPSFLFIFGMSLAICNTRAIFPTVKNHIKHFVNLSINI